MNSVHLKNIRLYGYHGLYPEETLVGGFFELSITINYYSKEAIKVIADTINYVSIYEMIKNIFSIPQPLLETLAEDMVAAIYLNYNQIKSINISIQKLNPPISNFTGSVGVQLQKDF